MYITKALVNKLEADTIQFAIVSDANCPDVRYITPAALVWQVVLISFIAYNEIGLDNHIFLIHDQSLKDVTGKNKNFRQRFWAALFKDTFKKDSLVR